MLRKIRSLFNNAYGQIQSYVKEWPDQYTKEFVAHNNKTWKNYRSDQSEGEILIEANNIASGIVAQSYLASYLGRSRRSKLIVFMKNLSRSNRAVYGSFVDSFLLCSCERFENEVSLLFSKIFQRVTSKRDLEELKVDNIQIGDLVYDLYLRKLEEKTVDLASDELASFLREALGYFLFWRQYFKEHKVKAVLVSHCVYPWAGVISRIAISQSVPVYLTMPNKIYYVTNKHNGHAYNDYLEHPEHFATLSPEEQSAGLLMAEEKLAMRFRGERDIGEFRQTNITYSAKTGDRVLKKNSRFKVLVASHCFSDDNHVFGNNLYPDIYEWLSFLGRISEQTEYDWYVKLHPDRYSWETERVEEIFRSYPRFTILASETPHHQIIEDGINCALTIYGSISFEYAALGVPVVTASPWTPTVAYNFNLHPKTVAEYENTILGLPNAKLDIDLKKVYEYYFCHYLDEPDSWLYESYERLDSDLGGGRGHIGSLSYKIFLDQFSNERHKQILHTLDTFVRSGDYAMRKKHTCASLES